MAPTPFLSDMRFDHDVAESTTMTPTVGEPSLWHFRQPFDPKSWPSAVTLSRQTSSTTSSLTEVTGDLTHSYSSDQLALMLQRQFDEENHRLAAERAELVALAGSAEKQRVFNCGMCMNTLPEESIARIEPCGHSFCRECVRQLIVSHIESRRFPILCPTCARGPGSSRPESIGKVTQNLVLDIGTTQEQYEKWIEMEMAEFLVLRQCPRCSQSVHFDKEGFNEARNLQCSNEGCAYAWCKRCQQQVIPNGPEHSCDGSESSAQKPLLQRRWTFGFTWSSIRSRVDVNASVQPTDIRVQLAFLLKLPV